MTSIKEVLVIRSASFQQLDLNLPAIKEKIGDCSISLLTHEHGVKLAEKYKMVDHIYVYPFKDGFKYKNKVKCLDSQEFDYVIMPVTNLSGSGYFNVLLFSLTIKTRKRMVCNLVSAMWEVTPLGIAGMALKSALFSLVSYLFSGLAGIVIICALPFLLKRLEKRG